jgi:hypothetical protein
MKLLLTFLGILFWGSSISQSQLDTLIGLRKTDFIEGKVPTYYSPGNKTIAKDFQATIAAAIDYYEKKYNKVFSVKLAVLDSAQWLTEVAPFGLIFYNEGWIVLNAGMNYRKFADMYGLNINYASKQLKKEKLAENAFITSVFKFYAIHELGHYFINELSNAKSPDKWTNEFTPTYFAYDFFSRERKKELMGMEIFSSVLKDHYSPAYSSIPDFNERYVRVGLPNYVWYHSNFYFLTKSLYNCKGTNFLSSFEQTFPKSSKNEHTTEEITRLLDTGCAGLVTTWVKYMEAKAKK